MSQLYFVRHGEGYANIDEIFTFEGGLTKKGIEQATTLANRLKGIRFGSFYSSPIQRAVETSSVLRDKLGIDFKTEEALAEFGVGGLDGKPYTEETQAAYSQMMENWLKLDNPDYRYEGSENLTEMLRRFIPFITSAVKQNPGSDLLFVSHGGLYRCVIPALCGLPRIFGLEHHIGNTEYILVDYDGRDFSCRQWGQAQIIQKEIG